MLRCDSLSQWREKYMQYMLKVDFEPFNGTPFNVSFNFPIGLPGVMNCRFSAGTLIRTPELIKGEEDAFQLMSPGIGGAHFEQRGRQVHLRRGEAILGHGAEPGRAGSPTDFGGIAVIVPRAEFEIRGVRPDDIVMQRMTLQCEALHLLKSYVRSVEKSDLSSTDVFGAPTAAREIVRQHIYDLATLAVSRLDAVGESDLSAVADARLRTALDYIAVHFDDPRLTVEAVARHQGVSPRYLQRLMKSSGRSYTATVNEMRLQKAFSTLTTADQGRFTILDIAMQAGFSDVSHFNRLFCTRFGDTPSGVRAQNGSHC